MNNWNGVWLLPTKGRPDSLKRFAQDYRNTNAVTRVIVIAEVDELNLYKEIVEATSNWSLFLSSEAQPCIGNAVRRWFKNFEWVKYPWIGLLCDDQIPVTPNWDTLLIESLNGKNFVSSNDNVQGKIRMAGAVVWSVPLLKAAGFNGIFPPKFHHLFVDDVWENIGIATDTWNKRLDIIVEHAHWTKLASPGRQSLYDDTSKKINRLFNEDKKIYQDWILSDFNSVVKDIKKWKGIE